MILSEARDLAQSDLAVGAAEDSVMHWIFVGYFTVMTPTPGQANLRHLAQTTPNHITLWNHPPFGTLNGTLSEELKCQFHPKCLQRHWPNIYPLAIMLVQYVCIAYCIIKELEKQPQPVPPSLPVYTIIFLHLIY